MTRNFVKGSSRDRSVWPGFIRDAEPVHLNTTEHSCFTAPLHVLGSCFGGLSAQHLAARYPERVRSLTLIGAFYRNFGLPDMPIDSLSIEEMIDATKAVGESIRRDFGAVEAALGAEAAGRLAAARDLLLKSQCTTPVNVMRYLAEVLRFEGLADLQRIAAPTLCITGSVDTIVMPDTAQVIASHVQRGRCKIITGAGHYPYLTHDDAFTPLVLQHMGAAERAPSADDKVSQHAAN